MEFTTEWSQKLSTADDPYLKTLDGKVFSTDVEPQKPFGDLFRSGNLYINGVFFGSKTDELESLERDTTDAGLFDEGGIITNHLMQLSKNKAVKKFVRDYIDQVNFLFAGHQTLRTFAANKPNYVILGMEPYSLHIEPTEDDGVKVRVVSYCHKAIPDFHLGNINTNEFNLKPLYIFDTSYLIKPHNKNSVKICVLNNYMSANTKQIENDPRFSFLKPGRGEYHRALPQQMFEIENDPNFELHSKDIYRTSCDWEIGKIQIPKEMSENKNEIIKNALISVEGVEDSVKRFVLQKFDQNCFTYFGIAEAENRAKSDNISLASTISKVSLIPAEKPKGALVCQIEILVTNAINPDNINQSIHGSREEPLISVDSLYVITPRGGNLVDITTIGHKTTINNKNIIKIAPSLKNLGGQEIASSTKKITNAAIGTGTALVVVAGGLTIATLILFPPAGLLAGLIGSAAAFTSGATISTAGIIKKVLDKKSEHHKALAKTLVTTDAYIKLEEIELKKPTNSYTTVFASMNYSDLSRNTSMDDVLEKERDAELEEFVILGDTPSVHFLQSKPIIIEDYKALIATEEKEKEELVNQNTAAVKSFTN